jgi:outer membrane lipoprotein-sorting protein
MNQPQQSLQPDERTEHAAGTVQRRLAPATGVPERPARAPNVHAIGEMQGVGFKDRQWLVQHDGRFLQLTELLYRVVEQANGERKLEEIAEAVTESTDWMVDADGVRRLIQTKLIPLGLVATADGSVAPRGGSAVGHQPPSPLAVYMRRKTFGPRVVDPFARALQVFYTPLILIPVLGAAAVAHWWLYRVHGLAESVRDVLYTPGGLLLVLALVVLAGMFHEFGHASALRYGGGRVRGMGVGLYLFYPVFYSDTTDSYRLGRWARVRTDLGGIYFHLIFALGLIALSVLTGRELLLFAVLLINLEILLQFLPLVRMDGYWLVADLTGIPDFFSQMGPFLRSVLPVRGLRGDKLPDLKPWTKAVFATYTVAAVPLLGYLFFLTVRGLPRFLAETWDGLLTQARMFSTAQSQGDVLTMLLLGTTMLFVALTALATLYVIYALSRAPIRALWDWSKPTPARRLAGALGAASIMVLLGFLWGPQLCELVDGTHPLFKQSRAASARVQTLRADLEGALGMDRFTGTVLLKRPNLVRIDIKGGGGLGEFLVVSDGKALLSYFPGDDRYVQSDPGPEGHNIQTFVVEQIDTLFQCDSIGITPPGGQSRYLGKEAVDGTEYDVMEVVSPKPWNKTTRYFISPEDRLIHQVVSTIEDESGKATTTWAKFKNARVDEPIDESAFRWMLPPTARPAELPSGITLPTEKNVSK